jgi:hypothetical protein
VLKIKEYEIRFDGIETNVMLASLSLIVAFTADFNQFLSGTICSLLASSFSLVPTHTSLSNIVLCAALTANPSLVAIDRTLFVDEVGSSRSHHLNPRISVNDVRIHVDNV